MRPSDVIPKQATRRWYSLGPTHGFWVDIINYAPDKDGMIQVRRVSDGQTCWSSPGSLTSRDSFERLNYSKTPRA